MALARNALVVSVLVLSGSVNLAQSSKPDVSARSSARGGGKMFARYNKPLRNATIDLGTGTLSRAPKTVAKSAATTVDFANMDLSGFTGVDSGGGFCEWIDAGRKGFANNASDLMSDIVFAYCSSKLTPASGGPGGSVRLGFYEGYTVGGATPTTAVSLLTLTGLPANSSSSSFFGGFRCYFVQVRFGNLVAFADGPIGYSWRFLDQGTSPLGLAGTWPFLACVVSCSGTYSQVDGQGMTDVIDEYCPPGTLRVIYTFASPSITSTWTSIAMQISEASDRAATQSSYNGELLNRDVLSAGLPLVGGPWQPLVTIPGAGAGHGHGSSGLVQVKLRTSALNGPSGGPNLNSPIGGRLTEVLIAGPQLALVTGGHDGAVSHLAAQTIPQELDFIGLHFAAQATVIGGGFADFSSALEGTVGTF